MLPCIYNLFTCMHYVFKHNINAHPLSIQKNAQRIVVSIVIVQKRKCCIYEEYEKCKKRKEILAWKRLQVFTKVIQLSI